MCGAARDVRFGPIADIATGSPTALNWDITLSNGGRICTSELLLFGAKIAIQVYEEHKTVWKATGTYKGEVIEVTGGNIDEAVKLWRDAATYRGNDAPGSENKAGQD